MVKAFRQKSFSFKRLHYSIKNYTKTVIPYSLSQELMTAAFTAALNGIYLFIIPMGIWIGSSTTDYQSFVASFIFLFDLCVCGGFHFDEGAVCLRQRHAGGQCSRTHGSGIGGAGNPGKVYGTLMNRLKA